MPCYNASRWLHEASESVLAQTFEDFEFIIVDDGSTDETWNIIQRYRERDQRIVAISKPHSGLADSLNVGIAQARGAWIARLDADDLCEPNRFEEQLRFVLGHPEVVLLGTDFVEIDEFGLGLRRIHCPSRHRELVSNLERLRRFFPHSSAFFKRDVARSAGCYNPWNRLSEDSDLWLRLAERGRIACLQTCLVRARKHAEQISNSRSADGLSQLAYGTLASVCHFLRIHGFPDPSTGTNETNWLQLVTWVNRRMTEEGIFERRQAWVDARAEYFASESRLAGTVRGVVRLLRSGHGTVLLWEKLFGMSVPKRLAQQWMERSWTASSGSAPSGASARHTP